MILAKIWDIYHSLLINPRPINSIFVLFLRNQKFSTAGDIWSLIIVFIEILQYGARPYGNHGNTSITWMLQNGEYELIKEILLERKDYLSAEALEMFDNCLIGSPATVREKVRPYYDMGVDHLICYAHLGQPHDEVMRSLELFARQVMPEFHHR